MYLCPLFLFCGLISSLKLRYTDGQIQRYTDIDTDTFTDSRERERDINFCQIYAELISLQLVKLQVIQRRLGLWAWLIWMICTIWMICPICRANDDDAHGHLASVFPG